MAQGYISAMATRAIIIIEADDVDIGLIAFVAIGIDEISTCQITINEGQRVQKGQETGMFHYGEWSHCVLFRKGVHLEGYRRLEGRLMSAVRDRLARASHPQTQL